MPETAQPAETPEPAPVISEGAYLAHRLVQLGSPHVLGLPGDFNLALLDEMLAVPGIRWVGTTNELNAAYATDALARTTRRPTALVTGMPGTGARAHAQLLHHTLVDGDLDHFVRACSEVAGSEAVLPEAHPASLGTYMGAMTGSAAVRDAVDGARPLVLAGTVFSDVLTGLSSHRFDVAASVELSIAHARVGRAFFDGVRLEDGLVALDEVLAGAEPRPPRRPPADLRRWRPSLPAAAPGRAP